MRPTRRRGAVTLGAILLVALGPQVDPPGPVERPLVRRYAIALEAGAMRREPAVAAEQTASFQAGEIFEYYGTTTDTFGREWHVLGDPSAWRRRDRWVAVPTGWAMERADGPVAVLTSVPPPPQDEAPTGPRPQPVAVPERWWEQVTEVPRSELPTHGPVLGLPAWEVPAPIVDEAIHLAGGIDALGPWPESPAAGRLHVPARLPLVMVHDGIGWGPLNPARLVHPSIGVLGNPRLTVDPAAPAEATGPALPCWRLVGGIDPRGMVVGRTSIAPPPTRSPATVRRPEDRFLGAFDMGPRALPVADAAAVAPRRLAPPVRSSGVLLDDGSRRQATYLEQRVPAATTAALRGRSITLIAHVRATPEGDGAAAPSATPGIELVAGELRETISGPVGSRPGRLTLTVEVPSDAAEIIVRLMPLDRSIAVQEAGRAIFDAVYLAPSDWPEQLRPAPLTVRRARVTLYTSARRYTRADLAVSQRSPAALRQTWQALQGDDAEREVRAGILAGVLTAGMSPSAVRRSWGEPERIESGAIERWHWPGRSAAFADAELIAWSEAAEASPERPQQCVGGPRP